MAIYIDDILLAGKVEERIKSVRSALASNFEVEDFGEVNYFLRIKIIQDLKKGTIWIGQPLYTEKICSILGWLKRSSSKLRLTLV